MRRFWSQRNEIPEHISVFQVCSWITFLGVNETREQNWIANEENRCIISNAIPDAIVGVEFNCKAAWITGSVGGSTFPTNS